MIVPCYVQSEIVLLFKKQRDLDISDDRLRKNVVCMKDFKKHHRTAFSLNIKRYRQMALAGRDPTVTP
jgi:hypothetical protein